MAYTDYIDPGNSGGSVPTPETTYHLKTTVSERIFKCEICEIVFDTEKQLDEHKYTKHPIKSPIITIKSEEIGHTRKLFFEKVAKDKIKIEYCTRVVVNEKDEVTPDKLIDLLSNQVSGFFKLELKNNEYSKIYEIEFLVADKKSLDAIDEAFTAHFQQKNLTIQEINQFANEVRQYKGGEDYASAYLSYLYGVLAKEQNSEILTVFKDYLVKFNEANEVLKNYPRSLARSVCAIIAFNNNFFETTKNISNHLPDIFGACNFIENGSINTDTNSSLGKKFIPIDWITEKIIAISKALPNDLEHHEEWLKSGRIPAKDKDKIRVLLARKYQQAGNDNKKTELLKSLRNNPDFESIINNIG